MQGSKNPLGIHQVRKIEVCEIEKKGIIILNLFSLLILLLFFLLHYALLKDWVFPIMWLIVAKPTQLCALSRIFKHGVQQVTVENSLSSSITTIFPSFAILVYTTHLALGDTWNKVFFGLQCIGRGTAVISIFFAFLLASTYLFYTIDAGAGYYMLPTCGWVFVATALQWSIYLKNKSKR